MKVSTSQCGVCAFIRLALVLGPVTPGLLSGGFAIASAAAIDIATEATHPWNNFTPANIGNLSTPLPIIFLSRTDQDLHTNLAGDNSHNKPASHSHNKLSTYSHKRPSAHSLHYKATKRLSVESCPHQVLNKCLSTGIMVDQGDLVQCLVNECHDYTSKLDGGLHAAAACGVHCWTEASTGSCSLAEMTTCGDLCSLGQCRCLCRGSICVPSCQGPTCKEQDLELCDEFFNCSSSCSCSCKGQTCSVSCGDCAPEDQGGCNSRCGVPCTCACNNGQCTPTCPSPFLCRNAGDCEALCLEPGQCSCAGGTCTHTCGNQLLCSDSELGDCSAGCSEPCRCERQGGECAAVCKGSSSCDNPVTDDCSGCRDGGTYSCDCFCTEGKCILKCSRCNPTQLGLCSNGPSTDCVCVCRGECFFLAYRCECPSSKYCDCNSSWGIPCSCKDEKDRLCSVDSVNACTCSNGVPCVCVHGNPTCQEDFCSLLDRQPCIDQCGEACLCICPLTFPLICNYACVTPAP
eukprot:GHVT01080478.1.p1 GENE.GHVT01080478.1~~GHVT01080478.1.p1  ORF type:complete len:516 (-),score=11.95 GHVT01080478.1:751-2298(-)